MLSAMLSSSSACLESFLLSSPAGPRFPVVGRPSYSIGSAGRSCLQSPLNSPELESDIGLQSPCSFSDVSNARITHTELLPSSQPINLPSTPKLGPGFRMPIQGQEAGGRSSGCKVTSSGRRRPTPARKASFGRCASISQVPPFEPSLAPESSPLKLEAERGASIYPKDIFSQASGPGLGLGITLPLFRVDLRRSTDEYKIIPITEVASGSIASSIRASSSQPIAAAPALRATDSLESPSPIAPLPSRFSVFNSAPGNQLAEAPRSPVPAPTPPIAAEASQARYGRLGHGLPSHMRDGSACARLSSIPEDPPVPSKQAQRLETGPELSWTSRSSQEPAPSSKTPPRHRAESASPMFFCARRFMNSARRMSAGNVPIASGMSPAMLLAMQSVQREDVEFRKKEGLPPLEGMEKVPSKHRFKFPF
ncbi:hypothetical protein B0H10DRAFT_2001084 [Mycena sp. CBHHK59/15]|nr:hypothetical protein B0H10DRAFT_2001084 [Mycena sp. CBHHK59/15]